MRAYVETRDNPTARGFGTETQATDREREQADIYLHRSKMKPIGEALSRGIAAARRHLYFMQDLLGLDDSARIDIPATVGGNWVLA